MQSHGVNLMRRSYNTCQRLRRHQSVSKGFIEFDVCERGKIRHIHSVHITERVPQKAVCDAGIVPVIERSMIYENGASQNGKGTDFSASMLIEDLRQWYRKHGTDGYIVMGDCHDFFSSIPHEVVESNLRRLVTDDDLIDLTMRFVNALDRGLTLGSQVNQINAVAAPDPIDHYIKEVMRIRHYCRHMDDWYAIVETKAEAEEILTVVSQMYADIGVQMNPRKTHKIRLSHGFVWLQDRYYLTDSGRVIRRAPKRRVRHNEKKLIKLAGMAERGEIGYDAVRNYWACIDGYMRPKNENLAKKRWADYYVSLNLKEA